VKKPLAPGSAPATEEIPLSQRRFFYLTAALNGAAIMIVEILGAKMLAPYVGTSHFVWTAQIAVTLIALATGYYVGGRKIDRSPGLGWFYGSVLSAGLYLGLTVLIVRPVAYYCLRFNLAMGSLLAAMVLYFIPLALLAMTSPVLIRAITTSVNRVGSNVGRLSSISTLGSVIGTVLIGYLLIPFLPNSRTMLFTACALVLIGGAYFLFWGKGKGPKIGTAVFWLLGCALGYAGWNSEQLRSDNMVEIFRGNSNFGLLQVIEDQETNKRYYLNDYLIQNTYDTNLHQSTAMFTYMLHDLARAYNTNIQEVLCIGMGVGIVPMQFAREGVRTDVVEINPAVVNVAKEFFDFEPARLHITIGDGRYYVAQCKKKYDAIILDAFLGDSSPSHLMTKEAFASMRDIMKPEGVLVMNCFGDFDPGKDFLSASLQNTLQQDFKHVLIHNDHNGGNVFMVASENDLKLHPPASFDYVHPYCKEGVERAFTRIVEADGRHGMVLTDNYNPVEFYDAANREEIRRYLANAMRLREEQE
jgi:spermidine synthase